MSDKETLQNKSKRWLTWEYFATASDITPRNRDAFIELLNERSRFHTWLTSLITGSVVMLTAFGVKPSGMTVHGKVAFASLGLMIIGILANLVCVWNLPSLKFEVITGMVYRGSILRWDLGLSAWIGVFSFVLGLILAAVAMALK